MAVLGVDGARQGWVGVRWDGTEVRPMLATTLRELCDEAAPVSVIAVDMPIGLSSSGPRPCDVAARPLLGPRRSSLFAPPVLGALEHATYAEANEWSKRLTGHGISKQAWMLVPRILEVRALAEDGSVPLYESFPELSFRAMNDGLALAHAKRTWAGMANRLVLLRQVGIEIPADAGPAGSAGADDVVDAAALAWSAARIERGDGECLPLGASPPEPTIWW